MKRLILVAGLALGLAACGGEDQQSADGAEGEDALTSVEEQAADMANAAEELLNEAAEVMEDEMPTLADIQSQFVADYAQGQGTVITDTGLMYRVEREGEGASPDGNDMVEVHYAGRLVDGTPFDSSYDRGETIEFPLDRVIPGWTEGLQYMQVGSKYQFVIPPELGYGSRGAGDVIPPNAVLVFDVELFNVSPVE
jgi:FKBP-type peptidyl-prolyl cis-trans isomerase